MAPWPAGTASGRPDASTAAAAAARSSAATGRACGDGPPVPSPTGVSAAMSRRTNARMISSMGTPPSLPSDPAARWVPTVIRRPTGRRKRPAGPGRESGVRSPAPGPGPAGWVGRVVAEVVVEPPEEPPRAIVYPEDNADGVRRQWRSDRPPATGRGAD